MYCLNWNGYCCGYHGTSYCLGDCCNDYDNDEGY